MCRDRYHAPRALRQEAYVARLVGADQRGEDEVVLGALVLGFGFWGLGFMVKEMQLLPDKPPHAAVGRLAQSYIGTAPDVAS